MHQYSKSPLRSNLGRVRGLGSAHHGAMHWWAERLTSLALIPFCVWFVIELVGNLLGASPQALQQWISSPVVAILLAALTSILFVHTKMGLQAVIEDYIHCEATKLIVTLFKNTVVYALMLGTLAAIAKLHFVGI